MIPEISEVHFPSYATLHEATVTLVDMGDRTITTQVRIDGSQRPEYGVYDDQTGAFLPMELTFKGERFVLPVREPQAAKENTSWNSLSDLTFRSWAVDEMMRYFYFQPSSLNASTAVAEKYQASVLMTLPEFVDYFRTVLRHYWPNMEIDIRLFMEDEPGYYGDTKYLVEIDHAKIWEVLLKIYEIFNVRWRIEPSETITGGYVIKVNYDADSIDDHTFQYGYSGGLMRFERQVQNPEITNILIGRGGEKNLPYRYFKRGLDEEGNFDDSATAKWRGDPDAIYELKDIYFDRLRDFNFRWYVRGWMQNPNRNRTWNNNGYSYPTYTSPGSSSDYYYAFMRGCTDTKFDPVEFVSDKFEYRNSRVTALRSIEKYGEHWGALDNIDSIYPTIQGHTISPYGLIDQAVAFSTLDDDDVDTMVDNTVVEISLNQMSYHVYPSDREGFVGQPYTIRSEEFTVPTGKVAQIDAKWFSVVDQDDLSTAVSVDTLNTEVRAIAVGTPSGTIPNPTYDDEGASIKMLPAGTYYLRVYLRLNTGLTPGVDFTGTFGLREITIKLTNASVPDWAPTFNMWIKNVWGTTMGTDEQGNAIANERTADPKVNAQNYAERVWLPILGDHFGKEAKIGFSTGPLSISEDYDFLITELPEYDNTQDLGGVPSEWKLTLQKSQAEYDATGLFIPNSSCAPSAGDSFFFLGIEIPNNYVRLAEEELTTTKSAKLSEMSDIAPAWVIGLDKVRVHTVEQADQQGQLAARLKPGVRLTISDSRFTDGPLELYAQSMTYRWQEPSDNNPYLVPDIEVVLTEKPVGGSSTIAMLQGQMDAIRTEYVRADQLEETIRRIASYLYLKKTGESDISYSPTQFSNKVTSDSFRQGGVGGSGWGIYRSNIKQMADGTTGEGDSVIEADTVIVRKDLQVNTLVVNQIEARGGKEILSAAKMEVTKVLRNNNSGNYRLYFDQRQGTVENLFKKDDIVLCQRYSSDWVNTPTKYYRMIVSLVRTDYVELDVDTKDGDGEPAVGDVIVQYGHKTDRKRQFVIIRDVVGGGYERMISGLTASYDEEEEAWVYTSGDEYFFAGRTITDTTPRWFVGYKKPIPPQPEDEEDMDAWEAAAAQAVAQSQYIEYKDGRLTIKGSFQVTQADKSTVIDGNLIQSGEISLGNTTNNQFTIRAGVSGQYDSTQPGGGIAGWYGGQRIDRPVAVANRDAVYADPESTAEEKAAADAAVTNSAKTAFRFDGSGYLASNRIYWDANGYGGVPGITWDGTRVKVSSDLMIETLDGQYETLINAIRDIMGLFALENRGTANARIKALYPLYSDGWISAGGIGSGSGGGGGTAVAWGTEVANQSVVLTVDAVSKTLSLSGHTHSQYLTASALVGYATENYVTSAIAALGSAASYGVASTVVNGDTTHLPTGDAVYDAIAAAVAGIVTSNFFEEYTIPNTSDKAIKLKSAYVGLFTESGFISAGGIGSSGGSGGSSVQWTGSPSGGFQELTVEGDHTHVVALQGHGHSTSESWLSSALAPYVTSTVLNTTLADYVTYQTLTNQLLGYVPKSTLASKGSASMPIYFDSSSVPQEITSLDLLSKNTGYVKANRFYLSSAVYFELNNGNVHLVVDAANGKGFYVDGFVSAGGIGSGGSAGGAAQWTTPTGGTYRELTVEGSAETVALSGHGHSMSDISGLGAAATYAVASSVTQNDTTHLVTGAAVWAAIDALPEPMVFKGSLGTGGTITSLPTASGANDGWTYKVITAGTYAGQAAQIGDLFISNGSAWIYIPSGDEPTGTVTSVGLSMPTGFSVSSSPVTSSGTLTVAFATGYSLLTSTQASTWNAKYDKPSTGIPYNHLSSGVQASLDLADTAIQDISGKADKASISAGTAGTSAPTTGLSFAIPYVSVNAQGIVTGYGTHSHSISASDLTTAIGSTTYAPYNANGYLPLNGGTMLNTTVVTNLNADLLDGYNASDFALSGHTHNYLPVAQVTEAQNADDNPTWGMTYAESHRQSLVYNTSGREWAYWIGMRSSDVSYGTILRLSHDGLVQYAHKVGGGAGENWSSWKNIITSDNIGSQSVASAAQLTTSRSIWGQSFNGSADVSGAMSGVTSIDSLLYFDTTNGRVGIGTSSPSSALHVYGGRETITNTGDSWANYSLAIWAPNLSNITNPSNYGSAPFIVLGKADSAKNMGWIGYVHHTDGSNYNRLAFGLHTQDNVLNIIGSGYVGIGTIAPAYTLDVSGDTRTSGRYYIGTTGIFLEKDSSGNVHLGGLASGCGFYTEGFVSAGGIGTGGSSGGTAVAWGTYSDGYRRLIVDGDTDTNTAHSTVALSGHTHDDRYLKLTGGALSGNLNMSSARIVMGNSVLEMGNGMLGAFTPSYPTTLFWYDGSGWQEVWHQGNDGSGSGLDADLLDGHESSAYYRNLGVWIADGGASAGLGNSLLGGNTYTPCSYGSISTLGKYNTDYYYTQLCVNYDATRAWLREISEYSAANNWHELAFLDSNVASATYATNAGTADVANTLYLVGGAGTTEDSCVPSSNNRVAAYYAYPTTATGSDGYIIAMGTGGYWTQIFVDVDLTYNMSIRQKTDSSAWTSWVPIMTSANIGSQSVASAAQLTTARSIWGQPFNGTGDVTGAMSYITAIDSLLYFDTTNSRVGVGTDVPYVKFEVNGTIATPDSTSIASSAMFAVNRHNDDGIFMGFGGGYGWIQSAYYGKASVTSGDHAYPLILNPLGGNVGIGTANPSYKLHVSGANTPTTPLVRFDVSGSGAWQRGVQLFNSGMSAGDSLMYIVGRNDDSYNMGQFYFYYAGANSTSNRLSLGLHSVDDVLNICGNSYVGVGTTSPAYKLDVNGTGRFSGLLFTGSETCSYDNCGNIVLNSRSGTYWHIDTSGGTNVFTVSSNTYVGIAKINPSYRLDVNGSANATTLYENGYRVITTNNIGSQYVAYASAAGDADTLDGCEATDFIQTVNNATAGHIATFVSGGGLQDSGCSITSDFNEILSQSGAIPDCDAVFDFVDTYYQPTGDYCVRPSSATSGNLCKFDSSKDPVDSGIAATNVPTLSGSNSFTGSNTFSDTTTISATLTTQHIVPSVSNTYNLGASDNLWANVYATNCSASTVFVGGQASYAGELVVYGTNGQLIHRGINYYDVVTMSGVNTYTGTNTFAATIYTQSIIPNTDATYDLGGGTAAWQSLYLNGGCIYFNNANVMYEYSSGNTHQFFLGNGVVSTHDFYFMGKTLHFRAHNGTSTVEPLVITSSDAHFTVGVYSDSYISAGGISSSSDARLKDGLSPVFLTLGQIASAPAVEFTWKKDGKRGAGSIAQYWQSLLPHNVRKGVDDYLTMEYGNIALLSAITIAREVETQEQKIARLEAEVAELKRQLNA